MGTVECRRASVPHRCVFCSAGHEPRARNASGFVLQSSTNLAHWDSAGFQKGAGNSTTQQVATPVGNGAFFRVRTALAEDRLRPFFLFEAVPTRVVEPAELAGVDPTFQTLRNLNTPEDYEAALRDRQGISWSEAAGRFEAALLGDRIPLYRSVLQRP